MTSYLLISDEGLEQVAAGEARERDPLAEVEASASAVRVVTGHEDRLLAMRTVHHVVRIRHEGRAGGLDDVRAALAGVAFPELERASSFRVTARTVGAHPFGHTALAGAAGAAIQARHGTPVDLEGYEVNIRVELDGDRLTCGVQLTRDSLGHRIRRTEALRTALRPTVAAAMLRLVGAHAGAGRLIDPMCGAATIPIEAFHANPALVVEAADWDEPTVELARRSLAEHAVPVEVRHADARQLGVTAPAAYDTIVTDPPYGLRQARRTSIGRLYGALLPAFERALAPGGRIAMVVVKHRTLRAALETTGLEITEEVRVALGTVEARVVVMERGRRAVAD